MERWIKDGAVALGWDPTLLWNGIHNLRHGVATEIYRKHRSLTRVCRTTGHAGTGGARRYARSNRLRLKMVVRSNAERAAAAARAGARR